MKKKRAVSPRVKSVPRLPGTGGDFLLSAFLEKHELLLIWLVCALAGLRIALFSAAFPLFNNVDEQAHYDLAVKYSRGRIPDRLEAYDPASSSTIARYGSPEYLMKPAQFPGGRIPPPFWAEPPEAAAAALAALTDSWATRINHESTQPPVYYALAGAWLWLGRALGLESGAGAYWLRFLNVLIYGLLVWSSYLFVRRVYPGDRFLRCAVPLMLAFFPQDVCYGINNDVLSPLLFLAALSALATVHSGAPGGGRGPLRAGVLTAVTFLVKLSNVAILGALAVVAAVRARAARRAGRWREELPGLLLLGAAALLPVGAWFLRNLLVLGDLTGNAGKIERLGWTLKPFAEIWSHPVFGLSGLATFWHDLLASFWRGEFTWHLERLATPGLDGFYAASSLILLLAAAVLIRRRAPRGGATDSVGLLNFLVVGLSVAFLLAISLAYDFRQCFYPSRSYPYLSSGRLMLGPLVPFLMLYLQGFSALASRLRLARWRLLILLLILLLITVSEAAISLPVFQSPYNLLRMPAGIH